MSLELARYGYRGTDEDFETTVKDAYNTHHSASVTIDNLLCTPRLAKGFCNQIRLHTQSTIPDQIICGTLMNLRKRHNIEKTGLKGRTYLQAELERIGYQGTPNRFYDLLTDTFANMFPSSTIDDLVCEPDQALRYCDTVRNFSHPGIPDDLICRSLMNGRK